MTAIIGKAVSPQRKRTLDALNLREPDRVPVGLWGTAEGYQNLRDGLGMGYNKNVRNYRAGSTTWTTDVAFEADLAEKLDIDFLRISIGTPGGSPGFRELALDEIPVPLQVPSLGDKAEVNIDEWGVVRKWTPHENGGYFEMIGYPLFDATSAPLEEGLKILNEFPWPDPWDQSCWVDSPIPGMSLREYCKYIREETPFALMGQGGRGGLFEQAKYMVGYAKIFSDFIESPDFLDAMMIKLVDLEIEFNKAFLEQCGEYIDWLRMSPEDLASEKTTFMSLAMFESQLVPHYKRATLETKKFYHSKNPDGKIQFHSCGAIP
jgi:uroporphyrinogen decarboxylase